MRRRWRAWDVAVLVLLAAWATPYFWQVRTSFTPDRELLAAPHAVPAAPTLAHYRAVAEKSVMPRALGNSLGVATLTTVLALVLGLPAAYAVARLPIPGKRLLLLVVIASTAFPQISTVSPLYLLLRALGLRDTWTALVLANTSFALPLLMWLLAGFIREIPIELEEAAFLDGAGRATVLRLVILPLVAPGVASAPCSRSWPRGTSSCSPTRSRPARPAARCPLRSRSSPACSRSPGATSRRRPSWPACRR
jgi:ABC-type glycerol-3-phosphate transport system permease component